MKHIFTNLILLIVFAIVFSSFLACTKTETPQNTTANMPPANAVNAPSNAVAEKTPSDYPLIPDAIAQADLTNLDQTTFKVADKKGKVILLNLWATWCGPCRSEMPTLVKMQDEHRDQNFEIIGIDTDDEKVDDINAFAKEMKLNYTLVWGDSNLQSELVKITKFPGIPQSFLIDRDGHLRGIFKGAGPSDVKKMEELVGKVVSE